MSTSDFIKYFKTKKTKFGGVFSIADVPNISYSNDYHYIFNLDNGAGTHWIALLFNKKIYYFDSYGYPPPAILESLGIPIVSNTNALQSYGSSICGQYCCVWCCEINVLKKYMQFPEQCSSKLNDEYVINKFNFKND